MALTTYAELVTAVGSWLNRTDLAAQIPDFITLFEARMNRELRIPKMEATASTSTASGTVALPSDFLSAREVYIDADPDRVLVAMSPANLRHAYPNAATGVSLAYTISGSSMVLAPAPSTTVTVKIGYYQKIPALTESNTSNWLLASHPDAYLYGVLTMAQAYLQDDSRLGVWKSAWDEAMMELERHGNKQRVPAGPLAARNSVVE